MSEATQPAPTEQDLEQKALEIAERHAQAVRETLEASGTFCPETIDQLISKVTAELTAEILATWRQVQNGAVMAVATALYPPLSVPNLGTTVEEVPK